MGLIRLIFLGGIVYFAYHLFKGWQSASRPNQDVQGETRQKPPDLDQVEVKEAKFKDIDE